MPKNRTVYQVRWEDELDPNGFKYKTWCKKQSDSLAWCDLCKKSLKVFLMGKSAISQHARSKIHKERLNVCSEGPESNDQSAVDDQDEAVEPLEDINTKVEKSEIYWSMLCAEHDLSFLLNDHTTKMFPKMFPDSAIASSFKCSRTKMAYNITHGTYETHKNILDSKLKENVFSLQIDESNKMYGKKFLVMLVKFFDSEVDKITTRFWELKVCNKSEAKDIISCITDTFFKHDIPFKNLIQIMSDSPNVMRGQYKGVITQMRDKFAPHLIDIGGCSLHYVHNAVKNATHFLYKAECIEEFLQDVNTFFNTHVEFAEDFSKLQEELQVKQHCLIQYTVVRFLSIYRAVNRVIEQYSPLKKFFLETVNKHPKVVKQARVVRISQRLKDVITLPTLEFLNYALQPLHVYELLFQRAEPTIHLIYNKQIELYRTVLMHYCKFEKIEKLKNDYDLVHFDYKKKESQLDIKSISLGESAAKLMKYVPENEKALLKCGVKDFLIKVTDGLHKDFQFRNKTLADMRFLAPANRTVTYERAIVRMAKKMPPSVKLTSSELDLLPIEWKYLVLEKFSWNKNDSLDIHWNKIFKIENDNGESKFPTITKVVKVCLSLCETNASPERTFSQIAHLIKKDRNKLSPETVNALMVTKSHMNISGSCYDQKISNELLTDVRRAHYRYENGNANPDLNNNNLEQEAGPSGENRVEDRLNEEIRYQEEKIKINNEAAQNMVESVQKIMKENRKLEKEIEKLKQQQSKNSKRSSEKHRSDHKRKRT